MFPSRRLNAALLSLLVLAVILGCRAADAISTRQGAATAVVPPTSVAIKSTATKTPARATPTRTQVALRQSPTATETAELMATDTPEPSDTPWPTTVVPSATRLLATRTPTPIPGPTNTYTPVATAAPTRCPQKYCVVVPRPCQPDHDTVIEGTVYANGQPENNVPVRVALTAGGYPLVPTFLSGTDPMNPGQPDPLHPGHYYLQVRAGAPQEGNWWVFITTSTNPGSGTQASQAWFIHTNDTAVPGNCQHAYVDFVR